MAAYEVEYETFGTVIVNADNDEQAEERAKEVLLELDLNGPQITILGVSEVKV